MRFILDASGIALLLSALLALAYEIAALVLHKATISDIVQAWGKQYRFLLVLIESVILVGLAVLGVHFLGGF